MPGYRFPKPPEREAEDYQREIEFQTRLANGATFTRFRPSPVDISDERRPAKETLTRYLQRRNAAQNKY